MIDEKKLIEVCRKNSIPDGNIFIESLKERIEELLKTGEGALVSKRLPEPWEEPE